MGTYLKTMSLQTELVKMRLLGWTLIHYGWCLPKKGKFGHGDRHAHSEGNVRRCAKTAVCEPRGEPWRLPSRPSGGPILPTACLWTSSLQDGETVNVCCLCYFVMATQSSEPLASPALTPGFSIFPVFGAYEGFAVHPSKIGSRREGLTFLL